MKTTLLCHCKGAVKKVNRQCRGVGPYGVDIPVFLMKGDFSHSPCGNPFPGTVSESMRLLERVDRKTCM